MYEGTHDDDNTVNLFLPVYKSKGTNMALTMMHTLKRFCHYNYMNTSVVSHPIAVCH